MELIQPGKYKAKPSDWMFTKVGKNATPAIQVAMQVKENDTKTVELVWSGFLTEKAKKNTLESLVNMGFRGTDLARITEGAMGRALDSDHEVSVTVEHEISDKGNTFARIRFINRLSQFQSMLPPSEQKSELELLNLAGDLLEIQQRFGIKPEDDLPI